jgi:riboflavin biosynthesis pyrimidine reductase
MVLLGGLPENLPRIIVHHLREEADVILTGNWAQLLKDDPLLNVRYT